MTGIVIPGIHYEASDFCCTRTIELCFCLLSHFLVPISRY